MFDSDINLSPMSRSLCSDFVEISRSACEPCVEPVKACNDFLRRFFCFSDAQKTCNLVSKSQSLFWSEGDHKLAGRRDETEGRVKSVGKWVRRPEREVVWVTHDEQQQKMIEVFSSRKLHYSYQAPVSGALPMCQRIRTAKSHNNLLRFVSIPYLIRFQIIFVFLAL